MTSGDMTCEQAWAIQEAHRANLVDDLRRLADHIERMDSGSGDAALLRRAINRIESLEMMGNFSDNILALSARGKAFTPGPWRTQRGDGFAYIFSRDYKMIAITQPLPNWQRGDNIDNDIANARLISAAPDLLDVVERLIEFNKGNPHPEDENGWAFVAHALINDAKAIIKKATADD